MFGNKIQFFFLKYILFRDVWRLWTCVEWSRNDNMGSLLILFLPTLRPRSQPLLCLLRTASTWVSQGVLAGHWHENYNFLEICFHWTEYWRFLIKNLQNSTEGFLISGDNWGFSEKSGIFLNFSQYKFSIFEFREITPSKMTEVQNTNNWHCPLQICFFQCHYRCYFIPTCIFITHFFITSHQLS